MRKECPGGFRTFSCSRDFGQRIVPPKGAPGQRVQTRVKKRRSHMGVEALNQMGCKSVPPLEGGDEARP